MKKLTDLNLITRDDINLAIDGKSITKAEFYSKNILELFNGHKWYKTKTLEYEYEMFFNSGPEDPIKIYGWYPIATDRIVNPEKIEEYIANGILRRVGLPFTDSITIKFSKGISSNSNL